MTGESSVTSPSTEPSTEPSTAAEVRGERGFRVAERAFLAVEGVVERLVPPALNPLTNAGAIANTALVVAVVTGVLLLIWYSASVHNAYASVTAMGGLSLAGFVRSLHRYSSDAAMFFVLYHAVRLLAARKVTGARWLAWATGGALLVLLWFTGWLGYWLVWDQRAQQVALGSAKLLDVLPVFVDPLSRSFLTDDSVNSLLFFLVFFAHMLVPMGMGVALWLHISRLQRSRFLTNRALTLWVLGSLAAVSLLLPASTAPAARMATAPTAFTMDWWYLLPVAITDRLAGGALWGLVLFGGVAGFSAPWWLQRRRAEHAEVVSLRCNACTQCATDCPYNAIEMIPRNDGRDLPVQAFVHTSRCVGCGICAGSCDSGGVGLPLFPVRDHRREVERWLEEATAAGQEPLVALVCRESLGNARLEVDASTGACAELPGYRVLEVPCLGWVHTQIVSRALTRGARGVLLAGCPDGSCTFREGMAWTRERMSGQRKPAVDPEAVDLTRIRIVTPGAGGLAEAAASFRQGRSRADQPRSRARLWAGGLAVAAALTGAVYLGSELGYAPPARTEPQLVVSFKHPGEVSEVVHKVSPEELAKMPAHMRRTEIRERRRAPVRLRVHIDGREVLNQAFPPSGIWGDGNSIAIESFDVPSGEHRVVVELGDSHDPNEWSYRAEQVLTFEPRHRRVVLFDRVDGFRWE